MLRNVHLYDELEEQFGIDTPGEAIRALSANFQDLMPTIRDGSWSLVMGDDIETGGRVVYREAGSFRQLPGELPRARASILG